MTLQLFQVDAFSNELFKGNPAAVYMLAQSMPETWMLALTQEMNLCGLTSRPLARMANKFSSFFVWHLRENLTALPLSLYPPKR